MKNFNSNFGKRRKKYIEISKKAKDRNGLGLFIKNRGIVNLLYMLKIKFTLKRSFLDNVLRLLYSL